ncbi:hypothetical protein Psuf_080450 [Phytohabitans suffuscus]|uniref:Uncharacterized protein n=1 Tax=Phytohabitans suffuscus TaxID=624315 RepID=A0A6F8YXA6_9ACTN|nr:hypothetical protein Psuf_080450 [Phytohabitans suffuscus]
MLPATSSQVTATPVEQGAEVTVDRLAPARIRTRIVHIGRRPGGREGRTGVAPTVETVTRAGAGDRVLLSWASVARYGPGSRARPRDAADVDGSATTGR